MVSTLASAQINNAHYDFSQEANYSFSLKEIESYPYKIAAHTYNLKTTNKGVFVTIHGYLDNCGYFKDIHSYLFSAGFDVICLELPGHGLSTGKTAQIKNFKEYGQIFSVLDINALRSNYSSVNFIAHSTAATTYVEAIRAKLTPNFDKVILLAPLGRSKFFKPSMILHSAIGSIIKKVPRKLSRVKRFNEIKKGDPSYINFTPTEWVKAFKEWDKDIFFVNNISTKPINLIFGEKDKVLASKYSSRLYKRLFPNSEITFIEKGSHHFDLDAPSISNSFYKKLGEILAD